MPEEVIAAVSLASARDCMADNEKQGRLDLRCRIDVEDEGGRLVHSLAFADAISVFRRL